MHDLSAVILSFDWMRSQSRREVGCTFGGRGWVLEHTTLVFVQPYRRPQENLRTLGDGVRVDAVASCSSFPPDLHRGRVQPARQSRITGSSSSGLDGTSHVAMLIVSKLEEDILGRACPLSPSSAPRFSSLINIRAFASKESSDPLPSFYLYTVQPSIIMVLGLNGSQEPTMEQVHEQQARRPSTVEVINEDVRRKSVDNRVVTGASQLTTRQSIVPVCLVTLLFFLWGFAYGLLDVLNSRFQVALNISQGESSGLQAAYFGAYFIGPLTYSGWFLRKFGYRYTFMLGLAIYCVGALMFWPSAVKRSFGGFCGSMFIVGSGLSTLETSANPYIAVCGPPKWAEFRLELSQSFQAVGSVVAPVLASFVIFKNVGEDGKSLRQVSSSIGGGGEVLTFFFSSVQWVYLGIAIFVGILAVVFYFAP